MTNIGKPKPVKKEKTLADKVEASRWCKKHHCYKWLCHPHRPSKAKPRKPITTKPKHLRKTVSKTERTVLESALDRLCSKFVIQRDAKCVTCGTRKNLTCSHFIKRGNQLVRYDVDKNLNCQCDICNNAHNEDESQYEKYLKIKHGHFAIETLKVKSGVTYFRWDVIELRKMVSDMKMRLENL